MATIEEVVKMWNKIHQSKPNLQTQAPKTGKNASIDGKIKLGRFDKRIGKEAVIKLSNNHPFEPWGERVCYVFIFNFEKQTNKLIGIEISFQRRIKEDDNTKILYEFLNKEFNNKKINGNKLALSEGKINKNHLTLKMKLALNSSAQDICKCMEGFIKLTQKPICNFLAGKNKNACESKEEILIMKIKMLLDEYFENS
jgi:hypothetical protein